MSIENINNDDKPLVQQPTWIKMMDIHPLVSTATTSDLHLHHHHHQPDHLRLYSPFETNPHAPSNVLPPHSNMIIDATTHNSSMPVSPKQGETITAEGLSKQDSSQLVSSSSSWEHHLSQKAATTTASSLSPSSILESSSLSQISSEMPESLNAHVWETSKTPTSSSSSSSPPSAHQETPASSSSSEDFQTNQQQAKEEDSCYESWNNTHVNNEKSPSSLPSRSTSSASASLPGITETTSKDFEDMVRDVTTPPSNPSSRNCDQPDSSPSSHSVFNSSFDEADQVREVGSAVAEGLNNVDHASSPGGIANMDTNFERRSRRKPTIEDIVRRVKPPVDAPPYDSEESEIEDDILNEEMMIKINRMRENDEVDGTAKPALRMMEEGGYDDEEVYKNEYRQFTMNRLSRLEAVDGIPENENEIDARSDEDLAEAEKRAAFYRDIPLGVYNIIHEVKVNAHAMFMKTANFLQPEEAKVRREQYLLQLLSNLRDRCLEEGIKPEIIGEILKDVENEISLINEDFEEMKQMKRFGAETDYSGLAASGVHFLSKQEHHSEEDKSSMMNNNNNSSRDSHNNNNMSFNSPTFLNTASSLSLTLSSSSSSTSSSPNPSSMSLSSSMTTSPSTKETKPIITTISADGMVRTDFKDNGGNTNNTNNNNNNKGAQPPPLINGGLPPLYPASNISETAFSPNMFPGGTGKMNNWFPGSLLNNMPFYAFNGSGTGSPLDHALARKFLPFEGKMGDSVDKDYLKCQFCERTFRRQKNLENHIENTHHGKNPLKGRRDAHDLYFKCSHCPYTTKHQSNLYVHLRIHTGERPYLCGACGVQYSQSHSLKSHIINKHDGIMSYYIKEKRTRSPRSIGYLSSQLMPDNTIFKLPPPPLLAPSMHHHTNLDFVNKAIEMAKNDHANMQKQQHEREQQLHQQSSPSNQSSMKEEYSPNNTGRMPPLTPLTPNGSNAASSLHSANPSSTPPSNMKPSPNSSSNSNSNSFNPNSPSMTNKGGQATSPHPALFMNGPSGMPPFMFGELPPHLRNPNHPSSHPTHPHAPHHPSSHPLFPGIPFPPHSSSANYPPLGNPGLSPLQGMSPNNSTSGLPNMPPSMQQMFGQFPHLPTSPIPTSQHQHQNHHQAQLLQHIKKEASSPNYISSLQQHHHHQKSEKRTDTTSPPRIGMKRPHSGPLAEEAIDLRKKTPSPSALDDTENDHDHELCYEKENCLHAAKLKYLRLNVVRMLGILVPNLNFAEKGISAESESVDELLQDVIESNVPEEEIIE